MQAAFVVSKEVGLEVNVVKTKYLFMSCEQNAGQNHEIRQIRAQLDMWQFKKNVGARITVKVVFLKTFTTYLTQECFLPLF